MPDTNAFAKMSPDDGAEGAKASGRNTMIVNAMDINSAFRPAKEAHVRSRNATISASINKTAEGVEACGGASIHDAANRTRHRVCDAVRSGVVRVSEGRGTKVLTSRPAIPDGCSVCGVGHRSPRNRWGLA